MADHHDAEKKGYESYDLNIWPIIASTAAIVAVAILSFIAMWAMIHGLEQAQLYFFAEEPPPMAAQQKPYTGPLLQADPPAELSVVRAESEHTLADYGWIDKDAGVVHIPIDRAITLSLQRGFPVRSSQSP